MLGWTGSSKEADVVECYFCAKKSRLQSHKGKSAIRDHLPIITGSIHHFLCPYCESWNIKDRKTGEFVDNVQAIHNEASPGVSAVQRRRSARLQDTPFCHNCLTNQQLQIQLLGGFLPAQITPREENELLARLPAYKESLNSRYPLVCAHCKDRIDDIIKERNWKAKARTVGGWLKNSASLAKNAVIAHPQGRDTLDRLPSLWLWRVKGICWAVLYTSTAMLATSRSYINFNRLTFRLDDALGPYLLRDMAPWRSIAAIITIFCSFWDPTYKERCQRGGRVEVKGYRRWMTLQAVAFGTRILWITGHLEVFPPWATYFTSVLHALVLLGRHSIVKVRGPKRVKLVERTIRTASSVPSPAAGKPSSGSRDASGAARSPRNSKRNGSATPTGSPAFGVVSMGSTPPPITRMYKRHAFTADVDDDMDEDEDAGNAVDMDWQPVESEQREKEERIQDVVMQDTSPLQASDISLRPAVFNPDDEWNLVAYGMKGLDSLFARGVSLDDNRLDDVRTQTTSTAMLLRMLFLFLALGLCCAGYAFYATRYGRFVVHHG